MLFQVYMGGGGCGGRVVHLRLTSEGRLGGRAGGIGADALQQVHQVMVGGQVGAGQVARDGGVVPEDDLGRGRLQL